MCLNTSFFTGCCYRCRRPRVWQTALLSVWRLQHGGPSSSLPDPPTHRRAVCVSGYRPRLRTDGPRHPDQSWGPGGWTFNTVHVALGINCFQVWFTLLFFLWQGGLSAQTYVHVEVEDLNDNAPVFNPDEYAMSISSHTQPGAEILNVIATDRDSGRFGQVTYNLLTGDMSSLFALDKHTGMWT